MMFFANRLTLTLGSFAGLISLGINLFKYFNTIYEFHGTLINFLSYLLEGIFQSTINAVITFCIASIIIYPIVRMLENRITHFAKHKMEKELDLKKQNVKKN